MNDENIKILVVDDTESSRDLIEEELADAGFQVEVAASGEASIEIVNQANGKFDFIIMDQVLLGGMDGIDATKIINEKFPKIRTIVITMYGDGEASRAALEAGAYRYVFRSHDLNEAIKDVIDLVESASELARIEDKLFDSFWVESVCEGTDMAIGVVDRTYRILYANKKQREIAGEEFRKGGICWVELHQSFQQKDPCPWCPVKPLFESEDKSIKVVPLFKRGKLQHWQTGASPILDSTGQIIAALKWGLDVTEREIVSRTALEAKSLDERLKSALEQIRILGYSRARLYELSEDDKILSGRSEVGGTNINIAKCRFQVNAHPLYKKIFSTRVPVIFQTKDRRKNTKYMTKTDLKGIYEWMEIPLWTRKDHIVGKIIVDNKITGDVRPDRPSEPRPITDEHFDALLSIAGFAANAIEETREHERTVLELELQRQLREIDAEITKELKIDPLLNSIVQRAVELLKASGGAMLMCDHGKRQVKSEVTYKLDLIKGMTFSFDEGLSGLVVKTGESKIFNNYFDNPRHSKQLDEEQYRKLFHSVVGSPIIWGNQVIGVINVVDKTKGRIFNNHDIELLESLARPAAIAIRNARSFEKEEKLANEMLGLYEVGKAITSSLKFDEVMKKIFESTRNLFPFENGLLFLQDKESDEFSVKSFYGYDESFVEEEKFTFRKGEGYTGYIIKHKKPLLIEDVKLHEDIKPKHEYIGKNKLLRSFVGVPLILQYQVIGVFEVTSEKPQAFSRDHLKLLRALADQLAIAIDRARLFEETDKRARQLASLHDAGGTILSNLTLAEVLKKITKSAKEVLHADIVDLFRYDHDRNDFILPPTRVGERRYPDLTPQETLEVVLIREIVKGKNPRYFSEVANEPDLIKPLKSRNERKATERFVVRENIKSSALIPCISKNTVVGLLCVNYRNTVHFTSKEKEIIEIFATLAATAIENARLHQSTDQQLRKRVEELRALRRADGAVLSTLELDIVLEAILDEICHFTGADCALVRLYKKVIREGSPDVLILGKAKGKYEGVIPESLPIGFGVSGQAAQSKETIIENDLDNNSFISESEEFHLKPEEHKYLSWIKSEIATPLITGGELRGILCAIKPQENGFPDVDVKLIEDFAGRAAIAINNALLKAQQERRIGQLKALSRISTRIQAATDPETMLLLALTGITAKQGLSFSRAMLFQVDESKNLLSGRMGIGAVTAEEAGKKWEEVEQKQFSFDDHLNRAEKSDKDMNEPLNRLIRKISIPIEPESGAPALCLLEKRTILVSDTSNDPLTNIYLAETLEMSSFVAVPLIAKKDILGVLIVDNRFLPYEEIEKEDVQILEAFATDVALITHNANLLQLNAWRVFSATAAHSIGSHVRDISGALTWLESDLEQLKGREKVQPFIDRMEDAIFGMQKQVRQFMELSQPKSLEFKPLDIKKIINDAIESSNLDKEELELVLQIDEKLPVFKGDEQALLSVFMEIIDNAVYEISKSKKHEKKLEISVCNKSPYLCIKFVDTGPGIPSADKNRIFNPFFTTREDKNGNGLSFVKTLIESHSGTIREKGIYGEGAVFEILFSI